MSNTQNIKKPTVKVSFIRYRKTRYKYWHLPIFTPRRQGTIFGTTELNFRVRYGNGWTLSVIDTNYFSRFLRFTFTNLCSRPKSTADTNVLETYVNEPSKNY